MKTFTYTQKKWAMASALLLVLGFNVSFNSHTNGLAALDLASTSDDVAHSQITTSAGVADVTYIKDGENKVLALVPKISEGSYCTTCDKEKYSLDVAMTKNAKDLSSLNIALMKKIDAGKAAPVVTAKKEDKVSKDDDKEDAVVSEKDKRIAYTKKKLEALDKDCHDEDSEKFDCYSKGVTDLLNNDSVAKKLDQKLVQTFVKSKVIPQAKMELIATTRAATVGLKIQAAYNVGIMPDANTIQEYNSLPMTPDESYQKRDAIIDSMSHFIETVPNQYEAVRAQFVLGQNSILQDEANSIQQQRIMAASNPASIGLQNDAISRSILLQNLQQTMGKKGYDSITFAKYNNDLPDSVANPYQTYFTNMMTSTLQTTSGAIIGVPSNSTTTLPGTLPADLSGRLGPGRGFTGNATIGAPQTTLPGISVPNTTGFVQSPGLIPSQTLPPSNFAGRLSGNRAQ